MQRERRAEGYALAAKAPVAEASTTATVAPVADAIDRQQSLLNTQAAPQEKTFLNAVKFDQFGDAIYSEGAAAQNLQQPGTNHLFTAHDKVLADYRKAVEMGLAEQIAVPVITDQTKDPNQFRAEAAQEAMFTNNMAAYMHQQKVLNARADALAIAQQQGIPPEQAEAYEQERQDIIEGNKFIQQQTKDMVRKYPLFAQKVAELQAAQDQADAERAQAPIMGGIKQTITGPIVKTIHGFGANMARFAGGLNGDDASFFDELGREMQRVNEVYTKEITPRSMEGPVIDTEKDAEGNEKQVIRGDRLLAASTGAITQAALLYATGGGAGVPAGAQRALMGGQAFVQSYPDYYDAAKRAGLSDSQAVLNATLNSGGQAMSESIFPEKYFPDGVSRSYKKAAIDALQGKGTTAEAIKQMTLGIGKQGAKEGAEEVAALLGERGVNAVTNKLLGSELEDEVTTNEVLEAGLLGVIAGSTLTGVGQLRTNPLRAAAIDWAVSNEAEFNAALDRQQGMTPEDKTKVKEKLAEIKAVRAGIPGVEQMSPDDRAKITDAVRAKNEVKNSGVVVDDAVAAATGDPVQARIAAYNDVIESMVGKPPPEKTADGKVKEPAPISPAQQKLNDAVRKELGLTGEAAPKAAAVPQPDAAPRGVDTGGQADAQPQVTPARITELAQKFIDAEQNGTILEEEDMDAISNNAQAVEAEVVKLREPKKVVTSPDLTKDIPDDENAIVDAYYDEHLQWNSEANPDYVIFNALAKSVKPSSFDQFGDANKRSSSIAKTYFAKAGDPRAKGLDQIAQEVSGMLGTEVTPDELVSFMESYQNGLPRRSPRMAEMNDRYQQITGKKLDAGIAARIIAKKGKSSAKDPEVQEFIEGFTDEEGNVNWQAVKNNIKALSFLGYTDEQAARIEAEADRQLAVSGGAEVLGQVRKNEGDTGQGGKSQNGSGEVAAQRPAQRQAATGRPNLDRMLNALRDIAPGITITIHDTAGDFAAGTKGIADGIASSWGVYDPRTNSIHINAGTATDIRQTAFHEAAHPLLIALAKNNPEAFMSFHEEVMSHPDAQKYRDHASNYADQSEAQQMAEALAEFLGDVAAGRVDVSAKPDSLWRRAMDWIKDVLAKLGWDVRSVDLSKPQTLKEFAFQFKKAMQKGIRINGFEPVGGGAPSLQDDADRLVDGWYSRLDQAVVAKGNTQSGADWMKWAEARAKEGMLSMEEVKWTGLADFLQGKAKVTPQQVRDFLKENRVKVEVVEKGGWKGSAQQDMADAMRRMEAAEQAITWASMEQRREARRIIRNPGTGDSLYGLSQSQKNALLEWASAIERAAISESVSIGENRNAGTKFSQYQLPGGTNYREVLVTLPSKASGDYLSKVAALEKERDPLDRRSIEIRREYPIISDRPNAIAKELYDIDQRRNAIDEEVSKLRRDKGGDTFHSSHFDEPNILAHLRLNDRTGPDGEKILFIEELQSDWGQQGKKKGFSRPLTKAEQERLDVLQKAFDAKSEDAVVDGKTFRQMTAIEERALSEEYQRLWDIKRPGTLTPSAPFVTSTDAWVELGVKQAIRMAAQGDYDRIAWTTGEQQNERYDLSKQVDSVSWVARKDRKGNYTQVTIQPIDSRGNTDNIDLDVDEKGVVIKADTGDLLGKRLDEVIGKDIADKVLSEARGELSGEGLKFGGTGMKGFYDKILPTVAKKVSKKLGGDGVVNNVVILPGTSSIQVQSNDRGLTAVSADEAKRLHASGEMVYAATEQGRGTAYQPLPDRSEPNGRDTEFLFSMWKGAAGFYVKERAEETGGQQSIAITHAMRERVGLGVPLMQYSDQQKAAIQKLINTKAYKNASFADKIRMQKEVAEAVKSKKKPASPSSAQQPSAPNEVKKTIATKRAYEGEFRSEVKKELERLGLTRDIESRETARKNAQALIDSVGIAAALDAVRNNDVPGGAGAYVWATAIKEIDKMMLEAKDQQTIDALAAKQAELVQELSSEALSKGRFNSALDDVYQNSDLGWSAAKKTEEWKKEFGEEPSAEVMERWRARDKEFADLKAKLAEAEARAQEAEENAIIKAIQRSIAKEKAAPIRKRAANPKTLASKIRGLKIGKPGVMSSFIIPPQLFDTAIEVVATAVEAGEAIASAIAKGLRALRDSDWYKGVDADVQAQADEEFSSKMSGLEDEDMVGGPLRIPKSMIRAAVENGASNIQELVAAIKEQIADTYPDATDREVRDAITDYGRVLNMSRDQISIDLRKMRRIGRLISQLEDVREKKRPLRSGLQRDKMDAEERALNKELREAMKALPPDPGMLEREFATALDAAKTRARNRIEDLQREIDTRTRTNKTASRVQPDEELIELQKQRDALQEEHDRIFVDRTASMEERVARAVESARRSLEDLERRIAEKDVTPKKSEPLKETPELAAIRAQRDAARQEYKTLQEQAGVFEARRLAAAKAAARARIDELDRRLENGDFSKKEVKSVAEDTELQALRVVRMRLQEEYDKEFHRKRLETRTTSEKVKDAMWEAWGLTRALSATAEMSFVLMQGGALTISNAWRKPGAVARAFKNTFRAMGSEQKSEEWLRKIKTQDWYPAAKEAGLAITEPHAELTAREELFVSDWTRIIWNVISAPSRVFGKGAYDKWKAANPFRALERGAVSYLDTLRAERFIDGMAMLESRKADGKEVTKQDYKDVADAINTLTGRASLGSKERKSIVKLEPMANGLAKVFFSPRLWSSTIKTATPYSLYYFGKMSPTARKLALQDLGRFVGTTMGFVALAALYLNNDDDDDTGVETDPRSSDFGKIKIGDTRIDPWGGRIQQVVFSTRMILGAMSLFKDEPIDAYKKTSGEISPLGANNAPTMFDTGIRMATNKLAPSASLAAEAMMTRVNKYGQRKTNFGEDFSLASEAGERLMPIYAGTVKDLMDEDPGALEGFLMFYSFFGGGVQEYDNDN